MDRLSVMQHSHDTLKCEQCNRICGKGPQEARHKPSPVALPASFPPHCSRCMSPAREPAVRAQRVGHDALLDDVERIACQPEELRR